MHIILIFIWLYEFIIFRIYTHKYYLNKEYDRHPVIILTTERKELFI